MFYRKKCFQRFWVDFALKNDNFLGWSNFGHVKKNLLVKQPVFIADSKRAIKVGLLKRKSAEKSCLEDFLNFGHKVSFLHMTKLMSDRTKNGLI